MVLIAHLKLGCRIQTKKLQRIKKLQAMKNVSSLRQAGMHKWKFPICAIIKVTHFQLNMVTALPNLEPGQLVNIEYAFINIPSVHGFTSYLSVTDNTTSYSFTFPTNNKRKPLYILEFIILTLKKQENKLREIWWRRRDCKITRS